MSPCDLVHYCIQRNKSVAGRSRLAFVGFLDSTCGVDAVELDLRPSTFGFATNEPSSSYPVCENDSPTKEGKLSF